MPPTIVIKVNPLWKTAVTVASLFKSLTVVDFADESANLTMPFPPVHPSK
jgi:hypothetical protein